MIRLAIKADGFKDAGGSNYGRACCASRLKLFYLNFDRLAFSEVFNQLESHGF